MSESIYVNAFRARIAVLLDDELCEAGAKESRKEEIHTMLNNGRWDCLRIVSTDAEIMDMISKDLMQLAHEEWIMSPNTDGYFEDDCSFSETISY